LKSHHIFYGFNIIILLRDSLFHHTQSIHDEYKIRVCLDEDGEKTDGITETLSWACFYCTSKSGGETRTVTSLGGKMTKTLAHQDVGPAPGDHIIYDRETD